jgi:hypothetical protein
MLQVAVLLERSRERVPLQWAATQLSLSLARLQIAPRTGVRAQLPDLRAAALDCGQLVERGTWYSVSPSSGAAGST